MSFICANCGHSSLGRPEKRYDYREDGSIKKEYNICHPCAHILKQKENPNIRRKWWKHPKKQSTLMQ